MAAYRSALEVYTREDEPDVWAGTQNNLAMALKSLGKLHKDAGIMAEAREAIELALHVAPDDADYLDTLKQIEAATVELMG